MKGKDYLGTFSPPSFNAISVVGMGTPFSQQVICCSWQRENGIVIIVVQVTLCVHLCLCRALLRAGTGLAESHCSIFSFLFSSAD